VKTLCTAACIAGSSAAMPSRTQSSNYQATAVTATGRQVCRLTATTAVVGRLSVVSSHAAEAEETTYDTTQHKDDGAGPLPPIVRLYCSSAELRSPHHA